MLPCLRCPPLTSLSPARRTRRTREPPARPPARRTPRPARISPVPAGSRLVPRSGEDWAGRPRGRDRVPGSLRMAPTRERGQAPLSPPAPRGGGRCQRLLSPSLSFPIDLFFLNAWVPLLFFPSLVGFFFGVVFFVFWVRSHGNSG